MTTQTPAIPFHGQPDTAAADIRLALEPLGVTLVKVVFELEITLRCSRDLERQTTARGEYHGVKLTLSSAGQIGSAGKCI